MVSPEDVKRWIEAGMPGAQVEVSGDGQHFEAVIVSDSFVGKSTLQQHQLVYRALGDKMQQEIHALSMKTLTPDQRR